MTETDIAPTEYATQTQVTNRLREAHTIFKRIIMSGENIRQPNIKGAVKRKRVQLLGFLVRSRRAVHQLSPVNNNREFTNTI